MKKNNRNVLRIVFSFILTISCLLFLLQSMAAEQRSRGDDLFGYGFNVAEWDITKVQEMGFNWMKVFNGPGSRLPVNILLRVDANASHMGNINGFGNSIQQLAQQQLGYVDAYEIGNEPNLDASYGWAAPPVAADYAALLCEAYGRIKAVDPNAIVVSAGLAPTGRVMGNWNGHPGHNGLYQDEREFFLEFVAAGGGNCLDAVGYHPYGYSADFDAEPDQPDLNDPTQNCANGFCFRGAEKLYELMQANGLGGKKMWATEYGWLTNPPSHCLNEPGWPDRQWQIVSEQKQADNLVGSFEYATSNWPWMEAMFIFNLNFNQAGWYPECEQMRFYSVEDRAADAALSDMPKVPPAGTGLLEVNPLSVSAIITPGQQPYTQTLMISLRNIGTRPLVYTATVEAGSPVSLTLVTSATGNLAPDATSEMPLELSANGLITGTYTGTITINSESNGIFQEESIGVIFFVWDSVERVYLPVMQRP